MKMMYEARVSDIGPEDRVKVVCGTCLHEVVIPPIGLTQGLKLPPDTLINSLEHRFRCRECDQRGTAIVTILWHGAPMNPMYRREGA